jgi:hypothetical protein
MNVFARKNCFRRKADDLVVATNWFADADRACRDFVTCGNQAAYAHVFDMRTANELCSCDNDVVVGMKSNEGVHVNRFARKVLVLMVRQAHHAREMGCLPRAETPYLTRFGNHSTMLGT